MEPAIIAATKAMLLWKPLKAISYVKITDQQQDGTGNILQAQDTIHNQFVDKELQVQIYLLTIGFLCKTGSYHGFRRISVSNFFDLQFVELPEKHDC